MAIEQAELEYVNDPDAELQEVRSLDAIRRDLADLEDRDLTGVTADLDTIRRRTASHLGGYDPNSDAWRAIIDAAEEDLDREERAAIQQLDAMRRRVQADREQLRGVPFRPALPAADVTAAEARAASLAARLPTMTAAQVAREVKGATLFDDRVAMAAWALLGDAIGERFPNTTKVTGEDGKPVSPAHLFGETLRACEAKTGDRQVIETRDQVEGQLQRINQRISAIAAARNAHNPQGGIGGVLASYQFGQRDRGPEQIHQERRYDQAAVTRRLGQQS
jgi:hypothetical protein